MVTFVVGLTQFMTQRGHGVTRGKFDLLYDPKVNLTFDLDLDLAVITNVQAALQCDMAYLQSLLFHHVHF